MNAPRISNQALATRLDSGEGIVVDLGAKRYYVLNETAMVLWQGLEQGDDPAALVRKLTETYDVTPERAAQSVTRFLRDLAHHRMVSERA
jgi:hypothetical protein